MLNDQQIIEYVKGHEGLSLKPYYCTANKLSIGIGRNLEDRGITQEEAYIMLSNDLRITMQDLYRVFGEDFRHFPDPAQLVFIDMMFQLGLGRFQGFKRMITAASAGDWKAAAREMMDSQYAKQVPNRAKDNEKKLMSCVAKEA